MKIIFTILIFASCFSNAARLEDVKVLGVKPGQDNLELKLQTKTGHKDSYFYVDIVKADPESFSKTMHIIKKMMQKQEYRLDLDIPSFSESPSGSYYKSESVLFFGTIMREPSSTKKSKKPKK